MPAHLVFPDIVMHSDDELAADLGIGVLRRKTIHEWPLSCVQGVRLADGGRIVYQSQLPPTVEPAVYDAAGSSPLLAGHTVLRRFGDCQTMVIDWIDAPLLKRVAQGNRASVVEHARRVIAEIGDFEGDLPSYVDIEGALDHLREDQRPGVRAERAHGQGLQP